MKNQNINIKGIYEIVKKNNLNNKDKNHNSLKGKNRNKTNREYNIGKNKFI